MQAQGRSLLRPAAVPLHPSARRTPAYILPSTQWPPVPRTGELAAIDRLRPDTSVQQLIPPRALDDTGKRLRKIPWRLGEARPEAEARLWRDHARKTATLRPSSVSQRVLK